MATLLIPVDSIDPAYDFQIDLENVTYTLDFEFNERARQWQMSIFDSVGEDLILGSVPVLINTVLLYPYRGIENIPPGSFVAIDETGRAQNPNRANFGSDIKLYYQEAVDSG